MKKIILLAAITSLVLTGCISSRSSINNGLDVLKTEHQLAIDNEERFSLELPTGFEIFEIDKNDEAGARLLGVRPEGGAEEDSIALIEENIVEVDNAIAELLNSGAVKLNSRSKIDINGVEGEILNTEILETKAITDYIFVRQGNRTYIFSLVQGQAWGYFESVVKTFTHLKDSPARAIPSAGHSDAPGLELGEIQVN